MAPTHDYDRPDEQPRKHTPAGPRAVPVRLKHSPRGARLRGLRLTLHQPRPIRPASVWPCAEAEVHEGTGLIAHWLLTAVIKIVTAYTAPGQRVLLLDPTTGTASHGGRSATAVDRRSGRSPHEGLLEAGWTVVRLGRSVQTQTAATRPNWFGDSAADASAASESGSGPHAPSPPSDRFGNGYTDRQSGPDTAMTGHGPHRFDLIITAAEPHTLDALLPTEWAVRLLAPTGTLAVITRSDNSGGRFVDPAQPLVRAAHHAGLHLTDRVALLRMPIHDVALAAANTAAHDRPETSSGPPTTSVRHAQAHDDLFVFTRLPAADGNAIGAETSHE